jgi:hypothetical protein
MSRDRGSTSGDWADLFEGAGSSPGVSIDLRGPTGSTGYDSSWSGPGTRRNSHVGGCEYSRSGGGDAQRRVATRSRGWRRGAEGGDAEPRVATLSGGWRPRRSSSPWRRSNTRRPRGSGDPVAFVQPNSHYPRDCATPVILAKAGIHFATVKSHWIPAFAGMTIGAVLGMTNVTIADDGPSLVVLAKAAQYFIPAKAPRPSSPRRSHTRHPRESGDPFCDPSKATGFPLSRE